MCVPRHPRRRVFSAGHNMVVSVPFPIPTIRPSGFPGATSSVSPRPMRPRDHCRFDELPPTRCPVVVQVRFEPAAPSWGAAMAIAQGSGPRFPNDHSWVGSERCRPSPSLEGSRKLSGARCLLGRLAGSPARSAAARSPPSRCGSAISRAFREAVRPASELTILHRRCS